jgi:Zn-dependent peptidase ImmA (M78 family)/predicted secreted protein
MRSRDAILEGAQAAARLHDQLGVRAPAEASCGRIDVFGALLGADAALIFRPLEGLLGACIRGPTVPGVIISTQRPLRIQRFTGAHELGHVVLGHAFSLDGPEILGRGPASWTDVEIAADSFASAFLIPRWLLQTHARRQGWNRESMSDPHAVYQLSLRVGASYQATCIALERYGIIDATIRERLVSKARRQIKTELLDGIRLDNYYADVWSITERDEGLVIEGQPEDLFVLRLPEQGGAGYLWNVTGLVEAGFAILRDQREIPRPDEVIGGPVTRALTARHGEPSSGAFAIELRRPWEKAELPASVLHLNYELFGKEIGMPRAARQQLMAA